MPFPDYTVDLSPKRARKNTRAHTRYRAYKKNCAVRKWLVCNRNVPNSQVLDRAPARLLAHSKAMARAAKPDMANTSMVSMEQHAEAADQTEAPRVAAANASCGPIWQAGGNTPTEPPEGVPLHKWSPG
jgi:hypothetical protein